MQQHIYRSAACSAPAWSRQSLPACERALSTLRQALERAGNHAAARAAFERALDLGAEPNPMQPCAADPAAPAEPGGQHDGGGAAAPVDEAPPSLTAEEVAASLGGLARAALRGGDLDLGLRAAAAAADAALSLACAGILERQGRLEVRAPHSAGPFICLPYPNLPYPTLAELVPISRALTSSARAVWRCARHKAQAYA